MAGLTKDGVKRVQVVIHGTPHNATFGHDAWYYRFPNNRISATAATKLIVSLKNGSTRTVPTRIANPTLP
jgi:outer membrane protein assembly factor BamE (lipoprotein component of BamABCDE complex)